MPALAAVLTLAGVVGLFLAFWPQLIREPRGDERARASATGVSERIEAGRRALADSNFRLAQRLFGEARSRAEGEAGLLSRDELRGLIQLQRQSELLALLLDDSLQEIVHRGALHRQEEEWQAKFASDFRGRSVIFDDEVLLEEGRPVLRFYTVRVGDETVRLALEDLKLLRDLQADLPRRLLFGARLADVAREAGGRWAVRFEADSGVLLTDEGAVAACLPGQPDAGLRDVLRWQKDWIQTR
jgi:hypothetical protein